jgi:hypothetical protein
VSAEDDFAIWTRRMVGALTGSNREGRMFAREIRVASALRSEAVDMLSGSGGCSCCVGMYQFRLNLKKAVMLMAIADAVLPS